MRIRFNLDAQSDADLIAEILQKANGGSQNNAARFLMQHWYENQERRVSPPQGQVSDTTGAKCDMSDDDLTQAQSILDDVWPQVNS